MNPTKFLCVVLYCAALSTTTAQAETPLPIPESPGGIEVGVRHDEPRLRRFQKKLIAAALHSENPDVQQAVLVMQQAQFLPSILQAADDATGGGNGGGYDSAKALALAKVWVTNYWSGMSLRTLKVVLMGEDVRETEAKIYVNTTVQYADGRVRIKSNRLIIDTQRWLVKQGAGTK